MVPEIPLPVDDSVARSQRGDVDAFGDLVHLHQGWVRGFLRARTRDWSAADDLAQEVFVTAFRRIKTFRGEAPFETWLRGIAVNHLRNFLSKRREESIGGANELQELMDETPEPVFATSTNLEALHLCLGKLDAASRHLLEQRYVAGKTVREMAGETGRGYSALTMQLHRLREILLKCITDREGALAQ
jgi:RNA polymerase sigma-70 factor (ECF subfamily)